MKTDCRTFRPRRLTKAYGAETSCNQLLLILLRMYIHSTCSGSFARYQHHSIEPLRHQNNSCQIVKMPCMAQVSQQLGHTFLRLTHRHDLPRYQGQCVCIDLFEGLCVAEVHVSIKCLGRHVSIGANLRAMCSGMHQRNTGMLCTPHEWVQGDCACSHTVTTQACTCTNVLTL